MNPINHPVYYRDLTSTHSLKLSDGCLAEPSLCFSSDKKTGFLKDNQGLKLCLDSASKLSLDKSWSTLSHFSEGEFEPQYDTNINPNKPQKILWSRINDRVYLTVSSDITNATGEVVSSFSINNLPLTLRPKKAQVALIQSSSLKGAYSGIARVIVCGHKITVCVEAIDTGKTGLLPNLGVFQIGPASFSYKLDDF